ncbi:hypothetical protein B0919_11205 [Hymenobacter sp. CRA2]|nr:hypothetical protein B0919_11205 [Hymenobacter sp. CRA2]
MFFDTWLYQHDHTAQDGSGLFLSLPFGIPRWRLSLLPWPIAQQDIINDLAVNDTASLAQAVDTFFVAHGGLGASVPMTVRSRPEGYPRGVTR